ncbi:MAG: histidine kinase [Lachnospiraceae bacterium]|nr:histidine kinase [Lachnospiraceae bacterium]
MKCTREWDELDDMIAKRSPGYLAMGFLFVVILLAFSYLAWFRSNVAESMPVLAVEGVYTKGDDREEYTFTDLDEISCDNVDQIFITGYIKQEIPPGEEVFFQVHRESIQVSLEGESVLRASSAWSQNWTSFVSEGIQPGDKISISIQGMPGVGADYSIKRTLQRVYCGDKYQLLSHQANRNMVKLLFCLLIFIMGMAELLTAMTLILMETQNVRGTVSCGLLMITGSMCCLIDYEYIGLVISNEKALFLLDITVQLSTCFFLIMNMMFHMHTKKNWLLSRKLLAVWGATVGGYILGHFVLKFPLPETVWLTVMAALNGVFLLAELVLLILDYRRYREHRMKYMIVSSAILTICILIEIIHFVIHYYFLFYPFQIGLLSYSVLQYIVIFQQSREREKRSQMAAQLEKELVQSQVSIMLSQIRPHFLYNSITAIQTLCVQDPEKARKSLGDFAKYLRGNMDSLASKELIPFVKELEHTRHYVELELMRQGEYLEVEYNIEEMSFDIPTLTLQPLVENAIKHGVGGKEDGGRVKISTYRRQQTVFVCVEDDGVGFDMSLLEEKALDKQRTHIGLRNVKERIQRMAGGDFVIESQVGIGTKITIILPQEE